jgi:hypothetical protein
MCVRRRLVEERIASRFIAIRNPKIVVFQSKFVFYLLSAGFLHSAESRLCSFPSHLTAKSFFELFC